MNMKAVLTFPFLCSAIGMLCLAQEPALVSHGLDMGKFPYPTSASPTVIQNTLFKEQFGAASPARAIQAMRGTANADAIISSRSWQKYGQGMVSFFGDSVEAERRLAHSKTQVRVAAKSNNVAFTKGLHVKGDLSEILMDDFYEKDGWEKLEGKRGRQGFDGLYVKRDAHGRIKEWMPVDAKSGSAKLGDTKRGRQMSPEWIKGNREDLIALAEGDYAKNPTPENKARLDDLKSLSEKKMRKPRIFNTKIEVTGGKSCFVMRQMDVDGNVLSTAPPVDMQLARGNKYRKKVLAATKDALKVNRISASDDITRKLDAAMKKGIITSDSDFHRFLQTNINNSPFRESIARKHGYSLHGQTMPMEGGRWKKMVDIAGNFMDSKWVRGASVAFDPAGYAVESSAKYAGSYVARHVYGSATSQAAKQAALRYTAQFAQIGMAGVEVVASAWTLADAYNRYNAGEITQTAFMVEGSAAVVAGAGGLFFTCTEWGAGIGTAICPGAGSFAGAVVGAGIGAVCAVGVVAYNWWEGSERQELAELEARLRAEADANHEKEQQEKFYRDLQEQARLQQERGWKLFKGLSL